jgi:hypothetical protein
VWHLSLLWQEGADATPRAEVNQHRQISRHALKSLSLGRTGQKEGPKQEQSISFIEFRKFAVSVSG